MVRMEAKIPSLAMSPSRRPRASEIPGADS
jgi:hypothetical protein